MRLMFFGVVLAAVYLSGSASADEASAVEAIQKLGGQIDQDEKLPGRPVVRVKLLGREVTVTGLKELKNLKHLISLHLGNTRVTVAGLKELKDLTQLTSLDLSGTLTRARIPDFRNVLPKCKIIP